MDDETLQEALEYCLDNPEGLETEELLDKFPESREELVPLLALCGLISEAVPPVPQERKEAIKGRIMAAAVARQQAVAGSQNGHYDNSLAATVAIEPQPATQPVRPAPMPRKFRIEKDRPARSFIFDWLKRPTFAAAAFAALLLAFVWALSASAMPDSPFYTVRLMGESIAVNLQTSPEARVLKHDELANIRLREIDEMARQHKLDRAGRAFTDYAEHLRKGQEILSSTGFTERQQNTLARALYTTSTKGQIEFDRLSDDTSGLPEPIRESLSETKQVQQAVREYSAEVLQDVGVPPVTILPGDTQDVLRQTPGADATALAVLVPKAAPTGKPTADNSSSTSEATATSGASGGGQPDRTATYVAGNLAPTATETAIDTDTPTATATQTTVPSATATRTSTRTPTSTATVHAEASALTQEATPTPTATAKPKHVATATPTRAQPTQTRKPESTRTPGRPPTHTPRPEKTKKPDDTATVTALPTSTSTSTPAPPTSTPVPPSPTPLPSSTPVPTSTPTERGDGRPPTRTPAPEPQPTDTAEPAPQPTQAAPKGSTACDVDVKDVSAGCDSANCVEWTAVLRNKGTEAVEIDWVAEMQIELPGAPPLTFVDSGTTLVQPGEEKTIDGSFCEGMPYLARKVRVIVSTDTGGASCDNRKQRSIDPCLVEEPKGQEPTEEPEPTKEPKPTKPPTATAISVPTLDLLPTRTPKP